MSAVESAAGVTPSLSVVIPIHNEAEVLEAKVSEILQRLDLAVPAYEILLCENGSTDATPRLADALAGANPRIRVLHLPEANYGAAMKLGLARARGETIVNFDIDYYDVDFVLRALPLLAENGIVVGSKLLSASEDRRSFLRRMTSRGFTTTLRVLFDPHVDDTHGIKAFRRDVVDRYLARTVMSQDLLDTELVLRARRGGIGVEAIPVVVQEKRKARSNIVRRIPRTMKGIVRLRLVFWKERSRGS